MAAWVVLSACGSSTITIGSDAGAMDGSVRGTVDGGGATGGGGGAVGGGGGAVGGGDASAGGGTGGNPTMGDTCATAVDVTAGGSVTSTTSAADVTDDYGPPNTSCIAGGSGSGADLAYVVSPQVTTAYEVVVTPLLNTFNPMAYTMADCASNLCVDGTRLNGAGQAETLRFTVQGGATMFVIVDGENATEGAFRVDVAATVVPPDAGVDAGLDAGSSNDAGMMLNGADTCSSAPDITSGGVFAGDTTTLTDDYGPSVGTCPAGGAASGRDVAYALSPSVTTSYRVVVTPLNSSFDPLLYAQQACGTSTCVAGTALNGPGQAETIQFSVQGGTTVFVIIDGENVTRGPFQLELSVL